MTNKRGFADVPISTALPDGLAVDRDDGVWSAHFNGRRITRYFPNGKIDFVIELPVKSPNFICFSGPDFPTLYVTSSTFGTHQASELDGSILGSETEFIGYKANRFDDSTFSLPGNDYRP